MCIKKYSIIIAFILFFYSEARSQLLINELACSTSGNDWIELFYYSAAKGSLEISGLYTTMYYGTNERLSGDPVTIYSYDRSETSWDDRFVVVHLTAPGSIDETDITGDTNKNGRLDVYCNNYSNSLWETDCVAAIDDDDDPSNNGIIDFMAYSDRDGTPNSTIVSYMTAAQSFGHWTACPGKTDQECMTDIGTDLKPYMSISRRSHIDTNSPEDFSVTKYMTPGRENILSEDISAGKNLFKPKKSTISIGRQSFANGFRNIDLFVFENCNIRLRIFSSAGMLIFESPLYRDVNPGDYPIRWDIRGSGRRACPGLYIGQIEATNKKIKKSQQEKIYVIVGKYKK
ncbi:MAG: hypothetical protein JXN64_10340 [Spirochaetes bacterium]|nr:hypothetical protein [Spirochaetota bacterium]